MYADREEAATAAKAKSSVKERLNRGSADSLSSRRNVTGKRQRQDDDKLEHDLFKNSETRVSSMKRLTSTSFRLFNKMRVILILCLQSCHKKITKSLPEI